MTARQKQYTLVAVGVILVVGLGLANLGREGRRSVEARNYMLSVLPRMAGHAQNQEYLTRLLDKNHDIAFHMANEDRHGYIGLLLSLMIKQARRDGRTDLVPGLQSLGRSLGTDESLLR